MIRWGIGLVTTLGLLAGCASPFNGGPSPDELAARAITMSGPVVSWEVLGVHPALAARPCGVSTLVNSNGQVVGYCSRGQRCRTMDWRPVEDRCGPAVARGRQRTPTPSMSTQSPAPQPNFSSATRL
jgi:hypothetical protein